MKTPTKEQQAVLERPAPRVRVVRAVPGSGKTWLVAQLIAHELDEWVSRTSGIAALSFTHVGGDEIRKAVGRELGHPHFVGTIDSFLFRYVVRPFLCRCFPWLAHPRLIPGEWGAEHWGKYARNEKATIKDINLFGCVFVDEVGGKAVVAYKKYPALPLSRLSGAESAQVKKEKKRMWERSGCLTHSDAALWASRILSHGTFGATVRAEVVRRFPLIIVDELQDTGYFLGQSILFLLNKSDARGVLVGDPDQAIYEFSGARPDLFNRFESIVDAVTFPLASSLRCPPAVAAAAGHLKDSGGVIGPADGKVGRAFLVKYRDMPADVHRLLGAVGSIKNGSVIKAIARQTSTVDILIGRNAKPAGKLGCRSLNHIQRAVVAFRGGHHVRALAAALAALDQALFQHEGVNDEELDRSKIDPSKWRALAVRCLLRANGVATTCTQFDWQTDVGRILAEEIRSVLGHSKFAVGELKPQKRDGWQTSCAACFPEMCVSAPALAGVPVGTVHSVKGETHDVTIFVCSPVKQAARCPSAIWWSADDKHREEKRIAYVAMTRTRNDLIVCVSEACHSRLCASRHAFVESFDCLTVDECIAVLGHSVPSTEVHKIYIM